MSTYTLTQKEYSALKGRLTRAKNSKDPRKIISEVDYAIGIFEAKGYPDAWMNWQRAKEDAEFDRIRQSHGIQI